MTPDVLEFERVAAPSELRLSEPITTPAGDRIRLVRTVGGSVVITPARGADTDLDTLVITGLEDGAVEKEGKGFWGLCGTKQKRSAKKWVRRSWTAVAAAANQRPSLGSNSRAGSSSRPRRRRPASD